MRLRFQHSPIRTLREFFGQEGGRTPMKLVECILCTVCLEQTTDFVLKISVPVVGVWETRELHRH